MNPGLGSSIIETIIKRHNEPKFESLDESKEAKGIDSATWDIVKDYLLFAVSPSNDAEIDEAKIGKIDYGHNEHRRWSRKESEATGE